MKLRGNSVRLLIDMEEQLFRSFLKVVRPDTISSIGLDVENEVYWFISICINRIIQDTTRGILE